MVQGGCHRHNLAGGRSPGSSRDARVTSALVVRHLSRPCRVVQPACATRVPSGDHRCRAAARDQADCHPSAQRAAPAASCTSSAQPAVRKNCSSGCRRSTSASAAAAAVPVPKCATRTNGGVRRGARNSCASSRSCATPTTSSQHAACRRRAAMREFAVHHAVRFTGGQDAMEDPVDSGCAAPGRQPSQPQRPHRPRRSSA